MLFTQRSSSLGRGPWSEAKTSVRWLGQYSLGTVPETEQIVISTTSEGRAKAVALPPRSC